MLAERRTKGGAMVRLITKWFGYALSVVILTTKWFGTFQTTLYQHIRRFGVWESPKPLKFRYKRHYGIMLMRSRRQYRLKASSLVEATMALSLITIVLGIGWMTVEQLLINDNNTQAFHTQLLLQQRVRQIEQTADWDATYWDTLGYHIEQQIAPLQEHPDYVWLYLICETPAGKSFELQTLKRRL